MEENNSYQQSSMGQFFNEDDSKGKIVQYEQTSNTKSSVTGEIIDDNTSTVTTTRVPQTPDFAMVFTRDLGYLKNITNGASKLLFGLIQVVDRNNEVTLNKARKNSIAENTGLKASSIDPLIKQLKEKEVLIAVDRGIYRLNPFLFGKGSWKNIRKQRITLEYDFENLKKQIIFENEHKVDGDDYDKEIPSQRVYPEKIAENNNTQNFDFEQNENKHEEKPSQEVQVITEKSQDKSSLHSMIDGMDDDTAEKMKALMLAMQKN